MLAIFCFLTIQAAVAAPLNRDVKIIVEDLGEDATTCRLSKNAINDRTAFVLRSANWNLSSDHLDSVYVNVNIFLLEDKSHCVYSVSVSLFRWLYTRKGEAIRGTTVEKGDTGIAPRANAADAVLGSVEDNVKAMIGEAESDGK